MQQTEPDHQDTGLNPPLNAEEARVLGCLIEKHATTPETYPLTLNAAVTACNQKTSRNPVMKLDPGRVGQTVRKLEQRGLVKSEYGARAERYYHDTDAALKITKAQRVLIGLLLLRGPQTLAELLTRSGRMHKFEDLDDVAYTLERMAAREPPLVVKIPRGAGQREDRWMHLLSGEIDLQAIAAQTGPAADSSGAGEELEARIAELEARIAALEERLDRN